MKSPTRCPYDNERRSASARGRSSSTPPSATSAWWPRPYARAEGSTSSRVGGVEHGWRAPRVGRRCIDPLGVPPSRDGARHGLAAGAAPRG